MEVINDNGTPKMESSQDSRPKADLWGLDKNTFLTFMHLAQFAGYIIAGLGFVLPIVMWLTNSKDEDVDRHGKNITNFMISMIIYLIISAILIIVIIGIPLLIALGITQIVLIILAAIRANKGEYWKYPLSIPFFK
ncbi:MAG: DUF4870 domain-containing protein [Dysgonomonas sp.]|nr:DUF4870 domain-containing protein [Dysgonomonas sp.]